MTASKLPQTVATTGSAESSSSNAESSEFAARCVITRRSALWAAYGDALGWISELTNSEGLNRRTGGEPLCRLIAWNRRIGGRAGINTLLPQGCYSDDSQLRLATSRAIGPNGFDVEAFSKIELPVWLSYALGGGKSTSAAAQNLCKPKVTWFANTFKGWSNSGGNGAAMRVQPHVWATSALDDPESYLPAVIRNTICTHSHPIGMLGSVIHALALAHTMSTGSPPSVEDMLTLTKIAARLPEIVKRDVEVGSYWRGVFERESGAFDNAWKYAIDECREAIQVAKGSVSGVNAVDDYATLVERLKLRDPTRRGSGMLTAIASVGLLWCEADPDQAMQIAANELGTDTDTIASMAGALVGVTADCEPPRDVLDADLFRSEAVRLVKIAFGKSRIPGYPYPDLLHWSPPSRRADALVRTRDGTLYVLGLGPAQLEKELKSSPNGDFRWQWIKLDSGQSLLIKCRAKLALMEDDSAILTGHGSLFPTSVIDDDHSRAVIDQRSASRDVPVTKTQRRKLDATSKRVSTLNFQAALDYIIKHRNDDKALGAGLRHVVDRGTPGEIAAFVVALVDELQKV